MDLKDIKDFKTNQEIQSYLSKLPLAERSKFLLELKLVELQVIEYKNKSKEKNWEFLKATVLICVGSLLTYSLQKDPVVKVTHQLPAQKIRVVHDTIYLVYPKIKDTSLVRIVKFPPKKK